MPVRRLACALATLAAVALPARASAWTDAQVHTVHAHVEVQRDGAARVSMELSVHVHAGWLEGLEIAGLDPDYVLDESKPPWAVSEDDPQRKFEPRVRALEDGRVQLSFRGRGNSPRRGAVRIGLVYTTNLAHRATEGLPNGDIRVRWTLPPWRSGLDGVTIALTVPRGAQAAATDSGEGRSQITLDRADLPDRTVLTWERAHLPRTVPWTVEVDVPGEAMAPALRAPAHAPRPEPRADDPAPATPDGSGPMVLAAILASLVLLSRLTFRRACRAAGAAPRPWLALPEWLTVPVVGATATLAAWTWTDRPLVALALLSLVALASLQRTPRRAGPAPRFGAFRVATPADLRAARRHRWLQRLGLGAPVDATTLAGLTLLAGAGLIVWWVATRSSAALPPMLTAATGLVVVPFLSATRMHVPTTPVARLALLERIARRLRALPPGIPACAYRLVVHVDGCGTWQDARLRIFPARPSTQLLRLDVAIAERAELGGWAAHAAVVLVSRTSTAVDEALEQALPGAHRARAPGDRIARIVACDACLESCLSDVLEALDGAVDTERAPGCTERPLRARRADPEAA